MKLLSFTEKGIYCPTGDFYIDPWQPVNQAVITHAHSDHARPGSSLYISHPLTKYLLQLRLGNNNYQTMEWGEVIHKNGVKISLHPAGHIIGSSQVRVEYNGEVWVVSGDYKTENDGISGELEIVKCDVFISESTFGLPIYRWKKQKEIQFNMQNWVLKNMEAGRNSVLIAYSLGKTQRILPFLNPVSSDIYVHGAIWNTQEALRMAGVQLPAVKRVTSDFQRGTIKSGVIIAPPGAEASSWVNRFEPYSLGICSGWMQVRGNVRRRNADAGFALSDHADWNGLLDVVKSTGAAKVFVTHGFQSSFSRYLNEIGIEAAEVKTAFGDELEEQSESQLGSEVN
ncbi:MAG: DNA ligase-associated DEXH box helicase [Bacteroidetes bacterium]|nr:MAG: DNA ligase-associated DEXH box helicase [Bacteroidota bacterium]